MPDTRGPGDKREALMDKVNRLNASFDDIAVAAIENLLYGANVGGSQQVLYHQSYTKLYHPFHLLSDAQPLNS